MNGHHLDLSALTVKHVKEPPSTTTNAHLALHELIKTRVELRNRCFALIARSGKRDEWIVVDSLYNAFKNAGLPIDEQFLDAVEHGLTSMMK